MSAGKTTGGMQIGPDHANYTCKKINTLAQDPAQNSKIPTFPLWTWTGEGLDLIENYAHLVQTWLASIWHKKQVVPTRRAANLRQKLPEWKNMAVPLGNSITTYVLGILPLAKYSSVTQFRGYIVWFTRHLTNNNHIISYKIVSGIGEILILCKVIDFPFQGQDCSFLNSSEFWQ